MNVWDKALNLKIQIKPDANFKMSNVEPRLHSTDLILSII
jgi:hypothetical protein